MGTRSLAMSLMIAGALIAAMFVLPVEACSGTISGRSQIAAAPPLVNQKVLALAKEWLRRIQTASIDRSQLNDTVTLQLTPELVRHEQAALRPYGEPISFRFDSSGPIPGATGYNFIVTCTNGTLVESIALDSKGKIAGFNFQRYSGGPT
jgi:hypothetical protein